MPYCPNPECPHRNRHGEPAEYLGSAVHCSDCDSVLIQDIPQFVEHFQTGKESKPFFTDFHRRLIYTFCFMGFWGILRHIGAPGIDGIALQQNAFAEGRTFSGSQFSIFALGLFPYLIAYVLVEVLSFFVQPLKAWRAEGYAGRDKLLLAARIGTVAIAMIHGVLLARTVVRYGAVVNDFGIGFPLFFALTVTAGTFILIWIADRITLNGVGHGISIIFFSSGAIPIVYDILQSLLRRGTDNFIGNFLPQVVIFSAFIAGILLIEKARRTMKVKFPDNTRASLSLKVTTAGIVPLWWADWAMGLPVMLVGFLGSLAIPGIGWFVQGDSFWTISHYAAYAALIMLFYGLMSWFFHKSSSVVHDLQKAGVVLAVPTHDAVGQGMGRVIKGMALAGALYLCAVSLLPDLFSMQWDPVLIDVSLIVTVAIAMDIAGELRLRRDSGRLVKVAEFQEPAMAGLLQSILKHNNIPCHLRGYDHRALLYFFGPYIEISVFVPESKAAHAKSLMTRYLKME
jgi:preprotein translocase subunit SecY